LFLVFKFKYINEGLFKPDFGSKAFTIGIYLFAVYFIYQAIWSLLGETVFIVADNSLIVKSGLSRLTTTRVYSLNQISDIGIRRDVQSSSYYWGFIGFRSADSESSIIFFNYHNQEIILGANLSTFNMDELKKWIS
jgi:hypothetical protein